MRKVIFKLDSAAPLLVHPKVLQPQGEFVLHLLKNQKRVDNDRLIDLVN